MFFTLLTKRLSWEILIKNLVTQLVILVIYLDGLRMKNINIMGVHSKIQLLGGFAKNQYIWWNCLKRGTCIVCRFKGGLSEKQGVVRLRGGCYPNAHYDVKQTHKNCLPSAMKSFQKKILPSQHFFQNFPILMWNIIHTNK